MSEANLKFFTFKEPSTGSFSGKIPSGDLPFSLTVNQEVELATIKLKHIHSNDRVFLTAAVGWNSQNGSSTLEFKIRSGGSGGPIVFSTLDATDDITSSAGAPFATTSLSHAEDGVSGERNYVLTVTLTALGDAGTSSAASIIGPIHFSGSVIDENE